MAEITAADVLYGRLQVDTPQRQLHQLEIEVASRSLLEADQRFYHSIGVNRDYSAGDGWLLLTEYIPEEWLENSFAANTATQIIATEAEQALRFLDHQTVRASEIVQFTDSSASDYKQLPLTKSLYTSLPTRVAAIERLTQIHGQWRYSKDSFMDYFFYLNHRNELVAVLTY